MAARKELRNFLRTHVIKQSDKGDRIDIMSKPFYVEKVLSLLESNDYINVSSLENVLENLYKELIFLTRNYLTMYTSARKPFYKITSTLKRISVTDISEYFSFIILITIIKSI